MAYLPPTLIKSYWLLIPHFKLDYIFSLNASIFKQFFALHSYYKSLSFYGFTLLLAPLFVAKSQKYTYLWYLNYFIQILTIPYKFIYHWICILNVNPTILLSLKLNRNWPIYFTNTKIIPVLVISFISHPFYTYL